MSLKNSDQNNKTNNNNDTNNNNNILSTLQTPRTRDQNYVPSTDSSILTPKCIQFSKTQCNLPIKYSQKHDTPPKSHMNVHNDIFFGKKFDDNEKKS